MDTCTSQTLLSVALSQNYMIDDVGRDIWKSSSPIPKYLSLCQITEYSGRSLVLAQICGFKTVTRWRFMKLGKWRPALFLVCHSRSCQPAHWGDMDLIFFSIWRVLNPCFPKAFSLKYAEGGKQMNSLFFLCCYLHRVEHLGEYFHDMFNFP